MKPKRPVTLPPATTARPYGSGFYGPTMILTLILFLVAGIPQTIHANCEVTFRWDPNNPGPEGYKMYGREAGQDYDYITPWWQGDSTFTQCTIDGLRENKTYFFVVKAFSGDNLSGDSNEVRYSCGSSFNVGMTGNDGGNVGTAGSGSNSGCFIQLFF